MKMTLYVFVYIILILIFSPGLSVSMCTLKVMQPQELLHGRLNQSVYIQCHVNMSCEAVVEVQWYVFRKDSYHQLDINNQPARYRLEGTGLHISLLSKHDDGVYYCAASYKGLANSGAQDIGSGTTLTVKDNDYSTWQVLLLTLVVLLSLYSLTILTLFICMKTGRVKLFQGRQRQSQGKATDHVWLPGKTHHILKF
ncbi:hypothetical protein QTP70_024101 [Hemibagrus guttatus]|uniref:Ig-like domain-containing protein n=1 Tax=Hemibagrus guttatus TaxID=175788 RepID=A0AAE0UWL2_9TELE|nr:hypothetical protein QTP70_024101 [Hemibagrus guttatus]